MMRTATVSPSPHCHPCNHSKAQTIRIVNSGAKSPRRLQAQVMLMTLHRSAAAPRNDRRRAHAAATRTLRTHILPS